MRLKDRVVVVTGAARGIGAEYCAALAKEGAWVAATDIMDGSALAESIARAGGTAFYTRLDVTDAPGIKAAFELIAEKYGKIDALVNNAAVWGGINVCPLEELTLQEWDRVFEVNAKGTFLCTQAVVPFLKKQGGGRIVNITSSSVYTAPAGIPHYIASKSAVIGLTRALARELGPYNITVNSIAPGFTLSEATLDVINKTGRTSWNERIVAGRCLQRSMYPGDLTGALIYLCSDDSSFMTGQEINVDGGIAFK